MNKWVRLVNTLATFLYLIAAVWFLWLNFRYELMVVDRGVLNNEYRALNSRYNAILDEQEEMYKTFNLHLEALLEQYQRNFELIQPNQ